MNQGRSMAVSGQFQYKKLSRQMAVSTGKKKWEAVSTTSHQQKQN